MLSSNVLNPVQLRQYLFYSDAEEPLGWGTLESKTWVPWLIGAGVGAEIMAVIVLVLAIFCACLEEK